MQTKLTLRLDEDLINQGKLYASEKGISLSRLVANYFKLLVTGKAEQQKNYAPMTESLRGILKDADIKEEDYHRYREEKHL